MIADVPWRSAKGGQVMAVRPFHIDVQRSVLDDLKDRLRRTRRTDVIEGSGWKYGTDPEFLAQLCDYWRDTFDWQKQQDGLNAFHHFRADVDGIGLHFIDERGTGSSPMPILLLHGWPDSFARFLKHIPMLTRDSFDVLVPSLPGYGFSDKPRKAELTFAFGALLHKLMVDELGYRQFAVHGGDWGGM